MNSDAVSTLLAKNPSLKTAKAKLEAMEPGAFVMHKSWGFGQIKSYDENAGRLIIDFEGKPGHPMDPAFCVTTMDILPAKHLLVRQKTDAATIARLIAEEPAELVAQALTAYDNNATTAIDLEITLAQVIGEEKFKKWWSGAKKAIAKDNSADADYLRAVIAAKEGDLKTAEAQLKSAVSKNPKLAQKAANDINLKALNK